MSGHSDSNSKWNSSIDRRRIAHSPPLWLAGGSVYESRRPGRSLLVLRWFSAFQPGDWISVRMDIRQASGDSPALDEQRLARAVAAASGPAGWTFDPLSRSPALSSRSRSATGFSAVVGYKTGRLSRSPLTFCAVGRLRWRRYQSARRLAAAGGTRTRAAACRLCGIRGLAVLFREQTLGSRLGQEHWGCAGACRMGGRGHIVMRAASPDLETST